MFNNKKDKMDTPPPKKKSEFFWNWHVSYVGYQVRSDVYIYVLKFQIFVSLRYSDSLYSDYQNFGAKQRSDFNQIVNLLCHFSNI